MAAALDDDSDAALLRRSAVDEAAFAVFYRRHERLVLGWCVRQLGDLEAATDLLAETFAAAWLGRDRYKPGEAGAGPWLLGIARNKLRVSARRQRIERSARARLGIERIDISSEHLREVEALFSDADEWLDSLPAEQREAVRAHVLLDEDYSTMAGRLSIGEPAARKRVSRGLAGLRRKVRQEGGEL